MNPISESDKIQGHQNKNFIVFAVLFSLGLFFCFVISYFNFSLLSVFSLSLAIVSMTGASIIVKTRYTLLTAFIISFGINFIICKNFIFVLLSLVIYPISFIFYTLFVKKSSRTNIVVAISVFFSFFFIIYIIFFQILYTGSFSPKSFFSIIKEETEKIVVQYVSFQLEVQKILTPETNTDINSASSVQLIYNMKMTLLVFIPSFFILFCNFLSYLTTVLAKPFFSVFFRITFLNEFIIERKEWRISPSVISAFLLPLTILLSMLTSKNSNIIYICIINNINLILSPVFFIVGLYIAKDYLAENFEYNPTKCIIFIILVIIGIFSAIQIIFYAFIVTGLISTAKKHTVLILEKLKNEIHKHNDDNNDDDDDNYY